MFKLVISLCFILIFVNLASSSVQEDAKKLVRQLKSKVDPKYKEFEENIVIWKNEVYDAVKAFDVKAEKDMKKELKRLNGIFDDLKKKNRKCVEDQKSKIAVLSSVGWEFSSCSGRIETITARNVEQILFYPYSILKSRSQNLVEGVKGCKNNELCLKNMISKLKKELKTLPSDIDKQAMSTKEYLDEKKSHLKNCSSISKLKTEGDEIIKKIKACSS